MEEKRCYLQNVSVLESKEFVLEYDERRLSLIIRMGCSPGDVSEDLVT